MVYERHTDLHENPHGWNLPVDVFVTIHLISSLPFFFPLYSFSFHRTKTLGTTVSAFIQFPLEPFWWLWFKSNTSNSRQIGYWLLREAHIQQVYT